MVASVPQRRLADLGIKDLLVLCCTDTNNSEAWTEFLRRFGPKIKAFARGTLRQTPASGPAAGNQESDLFQSTLVKLVEQECAVLKRFKSDSEADFMAYLAVITRSVVRDHMRYQTAQKRPVLLAPSDSDRADDGDSYDPREGCTLPLTERDILARELTGLSMKVIHNSSGSFSTRDRLIFELYYFHDLSFSQIAQCRGVDLSKAGVEKVLNRLKDRVRDMTATADRGGYE